MVDAHSVENALLEPLENAAVRGVEDVRALNAQADKSIHIEESTIAEFLVGGAPVGQSVVLLIEKFIERIVIGVQFRDCLIDCARGLRVLFAESLQQAEDHLLVAMARL